MAHYEFLSCPKEFIEPLYMEGKRKATHFLVNINPEIKEVDAVIFKDHNSSTIGLLIETNMGQFFYPIIEEKDGTTIDKDLFIVIDNEVINRNVPPPISTSIAEEVFAMFHVAKVI